MKAKWRPSGEREAADRFRSQLTQLQLLSVQSPAIGTIPAGPASCAQPALPGCRFSAAGTNVARRLPVCPWANRTARHAGGLAAAPCTGSGLGCVHCRAMLKSPGARWQSILLIGPDSGSTRPDTISLIMHFIMQQWGHLSVSLRQHTHHDSPACPCNSCRTSSTIYQIRAAQLRRVFAPSAIFAACCFIGEKGQGLRSLLVRLGLEQLLPNLQGKGRDDGGNHRLLMLPVLPPCSGLVQLLQPLTPPVPLAVPCVQPYSLAWCATWSWMRRFRTRWTSTTSGESAMITVSSVNH